MESLKSNESAHLNLTMNKFPHNNKKKKCHFFKNTTKLSLEMTRKNSQEDLPIKSIPIFDVGNNPNPVKKVNYAFFAAILIRIN
jgi:hypothetical protein